MIEYAVNDGLEKDEEGYKKAQLVIETRLKAIIAQNLFETDKFYEIITPLNETLIKAIELLQNDAYNKMDLSKN